MTKQINIRLTKKAVEELESLKKELGLSNVSEVIRSSIALSKFLQKEKNAGNDIILRNRKNSKERTIVMVN